MVVIYVLLLPGQGIAWQTSDLSSTAPVGPHLLDPPCCGDSHVLFLSRELTVPQETVKHELQGVQSFQCPSTVDYIKSINIKL